MAARNAPAGERMAVLETLMAAHARTIGETHDAVQRIERRLNKQMGFTAGVASVVSVAWALVLFAAAYWPFGK